ncbi:MAG: tetratricopeptide repeat protein [Terracidiphilus sp.]
MNRIELRAYIRYQLSQMGAHNGAHDFEQLCFALARLRHVSNLQPATGPVQAGGDQGRDFESFYTYLHSSELANSAFLSLASPTVVVGACTLERQDTPSKIMKDLSVIFNCGVRPDGVIYFCEPDIPIAKRHQLEQRCLSEHNASLSLHDGMAIADQLADPDTFWIAEQYLAVPPDFFPSDVAGEEFQRRRTRWLDERTKRIEAKLDGLAKDEKVEAAKRQWDYVKNHDIRQVRIFFALKTAVGFDWFRAVLNETRLTFDKEHRGPSLGSLLDMSRGFNIDEPTDDRDKLISSFWEVYEHVPGFLVRRLSRESRLFNTVAGFDVVAPWSAFKFSDISKLGDLATFPNIGISIPPRAYLPGVEEFTVDLTGDTFAFSIALSDHGLDFLHEMAQSHHAIAKEAKVASIGANFSGVQLLELFMTQLDPTQTTRRKGIGLLGLSGPDGMGIAFYPNMPPGFCDTPEASNYSFRVAVPGTQDPDADKIAQLEELIATKPEDPNPYGKLAYYYSLQGRLSDCIRCLETAVKYAKPMTSIHGALGESFFELGRYEDAAAQFRRATELDPDNGAAHGHLGACLSNLGDLSAAVPHLQAAVRLDPDKWRNHANLGFTLGADEKYDDAILSYKRAIELAPNEIENLIKLGWLFEIQGRYQEALDAHESAYKKSPNNGEACEHAGRMLQMLQRPEEAIAQFRRSIQIENTVRRQLELGDLCVNLNRWADAEAAFAEAIKLGEATVEVKYALAAMFVNQQKYPEAEAILADILGKMPDYAPANQLLEAVQNRESS